MDSVPKPLLPNYKIGSLFEPIMTIPNWCTFGYAYASKYKLDAGKKT